MAAIVQVTAWERVSLWRRIPCAFARVAALMAVLIELLNLLGPPITLFAVARWEGRKLPLVKVTPSPLTDYSVAGTPATRLSYFGFQFEVPWDAPYSEKRGNGAVWLKFDSGQTLLFKVPVEQTGLLTQIVEDKSMHMQNLRFILADLLALSPYDQYSAILNTTPSSVRAFGPRKDAVRSETLLTIKALGFPGSLQTGAFSFEFPDKRGFQIGDPQKSNRISLKVFDIGGRHVEIFCSAAKGVKFTQPELNTILKSLHPVADASGQSRSPN